MRSRAGIILLLSALLVGALGGAAWWVGAHKQEVLTDDASIERPIDAANPRDILWQPPEPVDRALVPADAVGGSFSPDGRFAFAATGPEGDLDLFEAVATRDNGWTARRLAVANSPDQDTTPAYSPDGEWLWFASDRPGGAGGFDLWRAPAAGDGWGIPEHVNLGAVAPTPADEMSPAFAPGGGLLAFVHRADAASPADIALLALLPGLAPAPVPHELNSEGDDRAPAFSPAGDFLYFASDREGGSGGLDLFRARVAAGRPGEALWLGEEVNSAGDETDPALTLAGFRLRFRALPDAGYRETTAREVYRTVRTRFPSLGVSDELLKLLPWLLLLAALVLLFSALRRLASRELWQRRWRTLGLMSRCVLASMAVHALLALLLSLWQVTTTLPGLEEGGETRVTLTSGAAADGAAAQVTAASITDRVLPPAQAEPLAPQAPEDSAEYQVATQATVAPANAEQIAEAAPSTATHETPEPAPVNPELHASTLPSGAPARTAESRSREAAVRGESGPVQTTPGSASEARLEPQRAAASSAESFEVREASTPASNPATTAHVRAAPADVETPTLPSAPRVAAAETASRDSDGSPSAEVRPQVSPAAPGAAVATEVPGATAPPVTNDTPDDARIDVSMETRSTFSPAIETAPPSLPRLPVNAGHKAAAASADPASEAPPAASAPVAILGRSRSIETPVARTVESVTAQPLPAIADTPLTFRANPPTATVFARAELPVAGPASGARVAREHGPPPAVETARDAPSGDSRSTDPIEIAADPAETDPIAPETEEARVALSASAPVIPLLAPRGQLPSLPMARVIAGIVLHAQTDEPVPGALVRLDGEGDLIRSALVGPDGKFTLTPAELPEFAALTASAGGFAPNAVNVAEAEVGDGLWVEMRLEPATRFDIALDPEPRVHHLGNDEFTGRINSQFQVRSQGTIYRATVVLEREQLLRPIGRAELHLFVRGAQNRNQIIVNDRELETAVTDSPEDGSFGTLVAQIPLSLLRAGENVIVIQAVSRAGTDIDDFEFVNPRLVLKPRDAPPANRI